MSSKTKMFDIFYHILSAKISFHLKLKQEKIRLPYNICLLDEIHANENAHNRILVKLLQYQNRYTGEYDVLKKFLTFLGEPFSQIIFSNPIITAEKNRIDVLIRDTHFSLIIENKIHSAADQEKQLDRYIEVETINGRDNDDIYILYLTLEGGAPGNNSFSQKKRNEFGSRYKEIDYKNYILAWLKNEILPWIRRKQDNSEIDVILESAVVQYCNHLEGKFNQREGEKKMKEAMVEFVKKEFNFNTPIISSDHLEKIVDFDKYISELKECVTMTKEEMFLSALKCIANRLSNKTIRNVKIEASTDFGLKGLEIRFIPENWDKRYYICFSFDHDLADLVYGIRNSDGSANTCKRKDLHNIFKNIFGKNEDPNDMWPYCRYIVRGDNNEELIKFIRDNAQIKSIIKIVNELINKTKDVQELFTSHPR